MSKERRLIDAAVAKGLVTKVPAGASGLKPKEEKKTTTRFHPDHCDRGGRLWRATFLDEEDEE